MDALMSLVVLIKNIGGGGEFSKTIFFWGVPLNVFTDIGYITRLVIFFRNCHTVINNISNTCKNIF